MKFLRFHQVIELEEQMHITFIQCQSTSLRPQQTESRIQECGLVQEVRELPVGKASLSWTCTCSVDEEKEVEQS